VTTTFLSRTEVAHLIGVQPASIGNYRLPPPDVKVGRTSGWAETTIREWHANRPGRGARTDLQK
jgi:predicted DNA-binding transcriptional regulator AlpA